VPFLVTIAGRFACNTGLGDETPVNRKDAISPSDSGNDIWHAANLMLKRYGEKALEESG
jgi:hypothetical protein